MRLTLSEIRTSMNGFTTLGLLNSGLQACTNDEVQIDCAGMGWLDANMASPLGGLLALHAERGLTYVFERMRPTTVEILRRNGFLADAIVDYRETTLRYTQFSLEDAVAFSSYTEEKLGHPQMPVMTPYLQAKFFEGLDEIFGNCTLHSRSRHGVHVCGQYYPRKKRIVFTITDVGIGVPANVRRKRSSQIEDKEAIDIAMQVGFTSRSLDVPGGLGLKIVKEFIEVNGGRFIVASHGGYWELSSSGIIKKPLLYPYPGTSVSLEIRTDDQNTYDMEQDLDVDILF